MFIVPVKEYNSGKIEAYQHEAQTVPQQAAEIELRERKTPNLFQLAKQVQEQRRSNDLPESAQILNIEQTRDLKNLDGSSRMPGAPLVVSHLQIENAKWAVFSDGSPPELITYDITLKLNNQQILYAKNIFAIKIPLSTFNIGDVVSIENQSYLFYDVSNSYYLISNVKNGVTLDFFGKSLSAPHYNYENAYPVTNLQRTVNSNKNYLTFSLKGYSFIVPDNNHTGLFQNMPIIIDREIVSRTDDGKYIASIDAHCQNTLKSFRFLSEIFEHNNYQDSPEYAQVLNIEEKREEKILNKLGLGDTVLIYHTVTISTTQGHFVLHISNTGYYEHVDCCVPFPTHPTEENDHEPKDHWDFYTTLRVGQQIHMMDDRIVNHSTGKPLFDVSLTPTQSG